MVELEIIDGELIFVAMNDDLKNTKIFCEKLVLCFCDDAANFSGTIKWVRCRI